MTPSANSNTRIGIGKPCGIERSSNHRLGMRILRQALNADSARARSTPLVQAVMIAKNAADDKLTPRFLACGSTASGADAQDR
jgi:hypothetical protein